MKHFVQYHNPQLFSATCAEVSAGAFEVATNKAMQDLIGKRLWVICGEGRPRRYFLCKSYLIAEVGEYTDESSFRFFVRGHQGILFQPPILLNPIPWFRAFRKSQSNFSFGLNRIHASFVADLEALAHEHSGVQINEQHNNRFRKQRI